MFEDDSLSGSYNNDVLFATPSTPEAKERLIEELKTRAKGSIGSRNYPAAVKLYTKAIETITDTDAENDTDNDATHAGSAILHANRSMCYLNMGNASSALEDASRAEKLDPSYAKACYRRGAALKALGRFGEAKASLLRGLAMKPDDKDLKAQLRKIDEDIAKHGNQSSTGGASSSSSSGGAAVKPARTTIATNSQNKSQTKSESTAAAEPVSSTTAKKATSAETASKSSDTVQDGAAAAASNMRGYKMTSDGRKTTFFNNELDETAKKLIGDIAPKKLDSSSAAAAAASTAASDPGALGSAWNSAGTYEERIITPWASARLTELLSAVRLSVEPEALPAASREGFAQPPQGPGQQLCGPVEVAVTAVENLSGDAQVSMLRGKKKQLCDYCLDLKWSLSAQYADEGKGAQEGEKKVEVVTGTLGVLDLTADREYEFADPVEVAQLNGSACTFSALPRPAALLVAACCRKSRCALQEKVHLALMQFCDELKTK